MGGVPVRRSRRIIEPDVVLRAGDHLEVVRGADNAHIMLGGDAGEELGDGNGSASIEARGGLVHKHQTGAGGERAGQGDALALSRRQPLDALPGPVSDAEPVRARDPRSESRP